MLSRGIVARNILRTNIFSILKSEPNIRLVIFVPEGMPDDFRNDFVGDNVIFEETPDVEYSSFRKRLFTAVMQKTVYTDTAKFMMRYGGRVTKKDKAFIFYILGHIGATIISNLPLLKSLFRFLEFNLFPDNDFDKYFEKYNPNLVVSTIIKAKRDIAILKSAKRFNVPNISMARSWDNLDRILIAIKPDKLMVQNEIMQELAISLHGMKKEDVEVVGFPQFDLYQDPNTFYDKDEFLNNLGLDKNKKTLFFASEGVWAPYGPHVVSMLKEMIDNNELIEPCQLIIRPHYSDTLEFSDYTVFKNIKGVYLDQTMKKRNFFTDKWDASFEQMKHLANELYHADILITYATTLSIEASILDTPVININFMVPGEPKHTPYLGMYYKSSHYSNIVRAGGVDLVDSREALRNRINEYLKNSNIKHQERVYTAKLLTYKLDGKSGERVANFILQFLNKENK